MSLTQFLRQHVKVDALGYKYVAPKSHPGFAYLQQHQAAVVDWKSKLADLDRTTKMTLITAVKKENWPCKD